MLKFQEIKTEIPGLVLQPLSDKHIPFLHELYNSEEIQKTLFRTRKKVTQSSIEKSVDKMHPDSGKKPSEITFILTLKSLLRSTHIGYVKVKLIDWEVGNCYISIAISPKPEFRGKGYSKATYMAFLPYLHSIGLHKVYGRTNAHNIATIKLNESTGFRFIGRQENFVIYPNNTSQDDLFFVHTASNINELYPNVDKNPQDEAIAQISKGITPTTERFTHPALQTYIRGIDIGTISEHISAKYPVSSAAKDCSSLIQSISDSYFKAYISKHNIPQVQSDTMLQISAIRSANSLAAGFPLLAYPLTESSLDYLYTLSLKADNDIPKTIRREQLLCNALSETNTDDLRILFLGIKLSSEVLCF